MAKLKTRIVSSTSDATQENIDKDAGYTVKRSKTRDD